MGQNSTAADHLYIEDVAEMLGVTVLTLRTMRKTGRAPEPIGRVGTRLVWDAADVEAWLEARKAGRARGMCVVEGCNRSGWVARNGRCSEHAVILEVTGVDRPGPLPHRPRTMSLAERHASWTILDPDSSCIAWTGAATTHGYGKLRVNGRDIGAHRVAWELKHEPIPAGLTVDHLCGNVRCQNDRHMELVDVRENVRREHARLAARRAAELAAVVAFPALPAVAAASTRHAA
ncbi:MAG: HNH endonuclease [Cellulomonas sp.]|nr:HNH endonuclease [Cellulomonas sp.]MCR6647284.1 HNH endonuclease [Cellulomonas sp.]